MLWYSLIVQAIGGKEAFENGLSDPAFVQAAEILKEMYSYTFDGAVSAGAGDVNGHFIDRSTAVYLNGPWWIKNLYKEDNAVDGVLLADVCDVAANPVFEGGKGEGGVVTAIQGALACAKQSDPAKEAAVIKFIKYISDPQRISEWSLDSGAMFFVKYEASPTPPSSRRSSPRSRATRPSPPCMSTAPSPPLSPPSSPRQSPLSLSVRSTLRALSTSSRPLSTTRSNIH